jgi:ribonuclease HI
MLPDAAFMIDENTKMGTLKTMAQKREKTTSFTNPVYRAYFDGSCGPRNPGGTAAYGAVIFRQKERIWECSEVYHPPPGKERETSNNLAEYLGLIAILEQFIHIEAQHELIMVYGDSNLVIQQMLGRWKIKEGIYEPFAQRAKVLTSEFSNIGWQWIPRGQNTIADGLSKAHLVFEKKQYWITME